MIWLDGWEVNALPERRGRKKKKNFENIKRRECIREYQVR